MTFAKLPTATPTPPVAIWVNDTPIFQKTVDSRSQQLAKFQPSAGGSISDIALDGLVDQTLMAQIGETLPGVSVASDDVTKTLLALEASVPAEQMTAWLNQNSFSQESFRQTVQAELNAKNLFEAVTASIPYTAPQIHAQCVQATSAEEADKIVAQLEAGVPFANFAVQACTESAKRHGGDIGWFAAGIGVLPDTVEAQAFELPVNTTAIFSTTTDYYVIHVQAGDENRPLTPEQHYQMKVHFFEEWFARQRAAAKIERIAN